MKGTGLNDSLKNLFIVKEVNVTNVSIPSGGAVSLYADDIGLANPDGYYPVAIRTFGIQSRYCHAFIVAQGQGHNTVIGIGNAWNSNVNNVTVTLHVVYCPNAFKTIDILPDVNYNNI